MCEACSSVDVETEAASYTIRVKIGMLRLFAVHYHTLKAKVNTSLTIFAFSLRDQCLAYRR
jgi:hypothetical protein